MVPLVSGCSDACDNFVAWLNPLISRSLSLMRRLTENLQGLSRQLMRCGTGAHLAYETGPGVVSHSSSGDGDSVAIRRRP